MLRIWGFFDLRRWGKQYFESMKVPRILIWCIRSYLFIDWLIVPERLIADALFTRISMPPKVYTILAIHSLTLASSRMSQGRGRAFPPAF